jgi:hypothetical protein
VQTSGHKIASQINIIEQLNGQNIKYQDYEIEIERLQTTCNTMSLKLAMTQDIKRDLQSYKDRVSHFEKLQKSDLNNFEALKQENFAL